MPNQDLIDCMMNEKAVHLQEIEGFQMNIVGAKDEIIRLNNNIGQNETYINDCQSNITSLTDINLKIDQIIAILEAQ